MFEILDETEVGMKELQNDGITLGRKGVTLYDPACHSVAQLCDDRHTIYLYGSCHIELSKIKLI